MDAKKIILVDDHVIVRNGLRALIEKLGAYEVIAEFDDGESFLDALPFKDTPDLVILDLSLPGMNGDTVMEMMNSRKIKVPVLVLTLNRDEDMIVKLFRYGVRGYLGKDCSADTMRTAMQEIFRCGYYHNEFLAMSLESDSSHKKSDQEIILSKLTIREREFLWFVCHEKEYTYEQIANNMNVTHRTVDGYRENIFQKFGIRSKTGLVLFVLKHRLYDFLQVLE
jgi:two-component system, NarL family, invasion response regulator UvrY